MTADASPAEAVMATLGYEPVLHRSVPGPLTKSVVLLLCVVAVAAALLFGGPLRSGPPAGSDVASGSAGGAMPPARPAPGPPEPSVAAAEGTSLPGDRTLEPEFQPTASPGPRLLRAVFVDRVGVRAGWSLRRDGLDASWLPGTTLADEPAVSSVATAVDRPLDDALLDRLITLNVDELRSGAALDAPVGLLGESATPDSAPAAVPSRMPVTPPLVTRSDRSRRVRLEPPKPPPPAAIGGRAGGPGPAFSQALRHHEAGDFERARREYLELIGRNDGDAEAHNNLGVLYREHGHPDEAVREFQRAIAVDPHSVAAHNNLGVTLLESGSFDAAARELRLALAQAPTNLESLVNLALALEATGNTGKAIAALHDALALDPRSPEAHYNLGLLQERHGDRRLALEHYRAFVRYGGRYDRDLIREVRRHIAVLAAAAPTG